MSFLHQQHNVLTAAEQTSILQTLICDVQEDELTPVEIHLFKRIKTIFQTIQEDSEISDQGRLNRTIQAVNAYLAKLEQCRQPSTLLRAYQAQNIYQILYHKPNAFGQTDRSGLKVTLQNGYIGVGFSTLFLISFLIVSFTETPGSLTVIPTALFTAAATYVSALIYGVTNDIFAARASLPYFLLGHRPNQQTLLKTNDPLAQGVAWGVATTFRPALLASIIFGLTTLMTAPFVPAATFILPGMMFAMPLLAYGAERYAQKKAGEYLSSPMKHQIGYNAYQSELLKQMCPTQAEKAAWLATNDRSSFGNQNMPLIGVGVLGTFIALSLLKPLLPATLFSPMLSVIIPAASAGIGIITLSGLGLYVYANGDKQIDNRYKLAFTEEIDSKEPELYLDEQAKLQLLNRRRFSLNKPQEPMQANSPPGHFKSPISQLQDRPSSHKPTFDQSTIDLGPVVN